MKFKLIFAVWTLVFLASNFAATRAATIYVVPPDTPDVIPGEPYNTWTNAATNVAVAVVYANVAGGDTVLVSNGVYLLNSAISVGKDVLLQSLAGAAETILDAQYPTYNNRVFDVNHAAAVVDGFTITRGNSAGDGAGVNIGVNGGTIRNCVIVSNTAGGGAGLQLNGIGPTYVQNCTVAYNRASGSGGGFRVRDTNCYITGCTILANTGATSMGGIWDVGGVLVSNCNILSNFSGGASGGIHGGRVYDSVIAGNYAATYGGGASPTLMERCVVSNNTGRTTGGGVYLSGASYISNCVVVANVSSNGGGIYFTSGGMAYDSAVYNNTATNRGGGLHCILGGLIQNTVIRNNTSIREGGGVYLDRIGNNGGVVASCTIAGNHAGTTGGGAHLTSTNNWLTNTVIYANTAGASAPDIFASGANTNAFAYCCSSFAGFAPERGNMTANPLFADTAARNYRLRANSPCINAGTNRAWMTGALDLDGIDRLTYTNAEGVLTVDMGCYEYPVPDLTVTPLTFSRTAMRGTINVMPLTLQAVGPITNYVDTPWAVNIASNWIWAGVKRGVIPAGGLAMTALTNVAEDLSAGVYNATAVYAVTNQFLPFAKVSSQVVSVALSVMELTAEPAIVSNTVMVGSTAVTQSFLAVSAGQGTLSYTVVTNGAAAWVSVSPGSGTLANNATNSIKLTYNTAGLTPGLHTASLTLATTNHGGATQTVALVMEVLELSFTPGALTNQALAGFAAPPRSLVVRNLGAGSFDYTFATNAPWLSVTPAFGTATGVGTTHVVAYASAALAPGAHTGVITLASSDHGGITQSVAATLNILSLDRAPALLTQSAERGATPVATGFDVWNGGAGRLDFTVTSATAWLGVTPAAGMSTGIADQTAITVSFVNTRNFAEGAYTGAVQAAGTDGAVGGATQSVTVALNVLAKVPGWFTAGDGDRVDGVLLQWEDAQAQAYEVWRARVSNFSDGELLARVSGGAHEYLDATALYGELYYYRTRPENLLGGYGRYSPSDTGWRGLAPPADVSASQGQYTNRVHVTWAPVPNAQRYEVWRAEVDAPVAAVRITTPDVEAVEFDDYTAVVDVTYYYWAKAKTDYTSGFSESAEGYRSALPPPGTLAASAGTYTNKVRLTWGGVVGALEYEIWRAASAGGAPALLALANALGYDDFAVAQGARYYYSVRARNRQSRSGLSMVAEGYADVGRAGLDLSGLAVTPAMIRAGGAPHAMGVNIRNLGPRAMSAPDGWLRFDLILSPTTNIADGVVAWSGSKYVAASAGNEVWVDLADLIAGAGAAKMQIPARFRGVYWLFLRAAHTPPSTLTGADAGRNAVMYASPVEIRRGTVRDCTGDWRSDLLVYDRASGQWAVKPVAGGEGVYFDLGLPGGVGVSGDYDGDGLSDAVMFRDGSWSARLSANAQAVTAALGAPGFQPVTGDFDGDGVSDPAVYRESDGMWYALFSGVAWRLVTGQFGGPGFQPVSGDFDGDGVSDPAIYREADGQWYAVLPGGIIGGRFGGPGYQPLTGDFDGDGVTDPAVHAVTTGEWQVYLMGSGEVLRGYFGGPGYLPVTGDFDGDRRCDVGIYRPDLGLWRLVRVDGTVILWNWQWGGAEWTPVR